MEALLVFVGVLGPSPPVTMTYYGPYLALRNVQGVAHSTKFNGKPRSCPFDNTRENQGVAHSMIQSLQGFAVIDDFKFLSC